MASERTIAGGRYTLEQRVGVGPLATVYRARCETGSFRYRVAVKHIDPELSSRAGFLEALRERAARLMGRPRAQIESIHDLVLEGDDAYLVVDWSDGPSLQRWVESHHERGEPAPYGQLLAIAARCLFGLHALHRRSKPLVHGAVGPRAIRINRTGAPTLTRFGVRAALEAAGLDDTWASARGLRCDAPEGGETVAADVFGIGLCVYTALAGATDLTDMPDELRSRLLAGQPADLNLIRQDIPAVVLRTIERALSPRPEERFESAGAMARSLDLILRSMPEMADPVAIASSLERVKPKAPKKPAEAAQKADSTKADSAKAAGGELLKRARPPARASGAPPPTPSTPKDGRPLGVAPSSTDQLDLNELHALQIGED